MADKTIYPYGTGGQLPSGIEIVNDLTTGGANKALSAEQGKVLGELVLGGQGTFENAYDKARVNTTQFFPWLLQDTDENGDTITKMIWHIGNKKFIDAIGANISGTKSGLTVVVSQACDMVVNGTTIPLAAGENNFTASELGLVNGTTTSNITNGLTIYQSGTSTSKKSWLTYADFGGLGITWSTNGASFMNEYSGLKKVKRLKLSSGYWFYDAFYGCTALEEVELKGSLGGKTIWGFFRNCTLLKKADLSELTIGGGENTGTSSKLFTGCTSLEDADVSGFNMSYVKLWQDIFKNCSHLKKLTIGGNFSNSAMTSKSTAFSSVNNCDLFITSTTPPTLKNCTFTDSTANDEHSVTYDWMSYISSTTNLETCRFRAIYVPDEAVDTYKTNVYVENGTVGNTGWSYYADIIKGVSEYVE